MITRSNYDLQFEVAYAARVCALHETVWRRAGVVLTLILVIGATAAVKGYIDKDANFAALSGLVLAVFFRGQFGADTKRTRASLQT